MIVDWKLPYLSVLFQTLYLFLCLNIMESSLEKMRKLVDKNYNQSYKAYNFGNLQLTNEDIRSLMQLNLKETCEIVLRNNQISDQGMFAIAQNIQKIRELRRLDLSINHIGFQGIKFFSKHFWKSLLQLNLNKNPIGNKGIKCLTHCQFNNITKVQLLQTQIGNEGVGHLSKAKWLNLVELNLTYNNITPKGFFLLQKCNFPAIKSFEFLLNNRKQIFNNRNTRMLLPEWPQLKHMTIFGDYIQEERSKCRKRYYDAYKKLQSLNYMDIAFK